MKKKQLINLLNIIFFKKLLKLNPILFFENSLQDNSKNSYVNSNVLTVLPCFKNKQCILMKTQIQILNINTFNFYLKLKKKNIIAIKYYNVFLSNDLF